MSGILFVTYGGGHVSMVIPVVEALRKLGAPPITVLGLTTAEARLSQAGIASVGFREFVEPGDEPALAHGRELAAAAAGSASVSLEESAAYLGLSYADLETRLGPVEAARQFAHKQRGAFLPLGPLRRVIGRIAPSLVVVTTSPRAERAAAMVAREAGITTVMIVDGFLDTWDFLTDPCHADVVLVPGEYEREQLLAGGRSPESIYVTGNPAYDQLADPELPSRGRRWRSERGWTEERVVLWATSTLITDEQRRQVCRALDAFLTDRPGWRLIYRPHPSLGAAPAELPRTQTVEDARTNIATLIHACDVVLVENSTVGLEAALSDRPVVKACLVPDDKAPFHTMGLAVPAFRGEEIGAALESCLAGAPALRSAALDALPPVGGAADRAAGVLLDLLHGAASPATARPNTHHLESPYYV